MRNQFILYPNTYIKVFNLIKIQVYYKINDISIKYTYRIILKIKIFERSRIIRIPT
jgi:hypothetical protein